MVNDERDLVWSSDMLGARSLVPILAEGTIVRSRERYRFLPVRTEVPFTMTVQATWRMADGVRAIGTVAIYFSDLSCHPVVAATILGTFGLEIAHDEMLEGDCPGDDNDICIISSPCLCLFALLARMSSPSSTSLPTTRSRTLLFISYRDSRARSTRFSRPQSSYDEADQPADENERLITRHLTLDLHLPPKWVDLAEQVGEILASVHSKLSSLEKLHAKRALPGFADRSAEEREIEAATANITNDLQRCHTLIQRISTDHGHSFPPSNRNHHELLAAQNVQRGLAARVQALSSTFRKKQRIYMERLQGHAIKNQDLLIASGTIASKGSEGLSAVDDDVQAAQAQIMETDQTDHLRLRDRELTHIANSIASLGDLFKDLSILVIDQGTLLDSIEYNIEQTSVQVSEAVKELDIATRYQKNTGRRKIIFLLLLIIFGLIIILIFKPRRHSSSSPSDGTLDSPQSRSFVPVYMRQRTPS